MLATGARLGLNVKSLVVLVAIRLSLESYALIVSLRSCGVIDVNTVEYLACPYVESSLVA